MQNFKENAIDRDLRKKEILAIVITVEDLNFFLYERKFTI